LVEDNETIQITLVPDSSYTLGFRDQAITTIISDDIESTLFASLSVIDAEGFEENSDPARFEITLSEPASQPIDIFYRVDGNITNDGMDFIPLNGVATIQEGDSSTEITIQVNDDTFDEFNENVIITLQPGVGYEVGAPLAGTAFIIDNDSGPVPTVAIITTGHNANESDLTPGEFTLTVDPALV
jgi:hypothetical protein